MGNSSSLCIVSLGYVFRGLETESLTLSLSPYWVVGGRSGGVGGTGLWLLSSHVAG